MLSDFLPGLLPAIALYPEIHYRFKFFPFSRYYRRLPEIIADAPHRLDPGQPLPLLLLMKCTHNFPVVLGRVEVEARTRDRVVRRQIACGETISQPGWHRVEFLELPDASPAVWDVTVIFHLTIAGENYKVTVDNLPGLSHAPLRVVQSGCTLPKEEGWRFGDLHVHTAYTDDQVEFGAPMESYYIFGPAQGISFALPADHSYDLDNPSESWTGSDPAATRFVMRSKELDILNDLHRSTFTLLPGYELSAGNSKMRNVHLLLMGQKVLLPGSGDSAERWLRTRPELSVREVLEKCREEVLCVPAHPMVRPPLLERMLLRRGRWEDVDLDDNRLFGLQVWNGEKTLAFESGIQRWVKGLLQGRRWKIIAGSDAHGNFNRYRQVGFPMLNLTENQTHLFGQVWTGVKLKDEFDPEEIIVALRNARSLVSDGPFADLEIVSATDRPGIRITALSSAEFGELSRIEVFQGLPGEDHERVLLKEIPRGVYRWEKQLPLPVAEGYIRMQAITRQDHRCLTNPVYF